MAASGGRRGARISVTQVGHGRAFLLASVHIINIPSLTDRRVTSSTMQQCTVPCNIHHFYMVLLKFFRHNGVVRFLEFVSCKKLVLQCSRASSRAPLLTKLQHCLTFYQTTQNFVD